MSFSLKYTQVVHHIKYGHVLPMSDNQEVFQNLNKPYIHNKRTFPVWFKCSKYVFRLSIRSKNRKIPQFERLRKMPVFSMTFSSSHRQTHQTTLLMKDS